MTKEELLELVLKKYKNLSKIVEDKNKIIEAFNKNYSTIKANERTLSTIKSLIDCMSFREKYEDDKNFIAKHLTLDVINKGEQIEKIFQHNDISKYLSKIELTFEQAEDFVSKAQQIHYINRKAIKDENPEHQDNIHSDTEDYTGRNIDIKDDDYKKVIEAIKELYKNEQIPLLEYISFCYIFFPEVVFVELLIETENNKKITTIINKEKEENKKIIKSLFPNIMELLEKYIQKIKEAKEILIKKERNEKNNEKITTIIDNEIEENKKEASEESNLTIRILAHNAYIRLSLLLKPNSEAINIIHNHFFPPGV